MTGKARSARWGSAERVCPLPKELATSIGGILGPLWIRIKCVGTTSLHVLGYRCGADRVSFRLSFPACHLLVLRQVMAIGWWWRSPMRVSCFAHPDYLTDLGDRLGPDAWESKQFRISRTVDFAERSEADHLQLGAHPAKHNHPVARGDVLPSAFAAIPFLKSAPQDGSQPATCTTRTAPAFQNARRVDSRR